MMRYRRYRSQAEQDLFPDYYTVQQLKEIRERWPDLGREPISKNFKEAKPKKRKPPLDEFDHKPPTEKQLQLLSILTTRIVKFNPLNGDEKDKFLTYADATVKLGVTEGAVKQQMQTLKKNCPKTYADFKRTKGRKPGSFYNPIKLTKKEWELITTDPKEYEGYELERYKVRHKW